MSLGNRRDARAYTVIEVMIAMVIFTIGIMSLYALQVVTISGLEDSRELTEATDLAERVIEQFRRNSTTTEQHLPPAGDAGTWWAYFAGPVDKDGLLQEQIPNGTPAAPARYCVKYRMKEIPSVGSGVYRLEVRVMWPRREGTESQFTACPANMDSTDNVPLVRQITLPGGTFRHVGGAT